MKDTTIDPAVVSQWLAARGSSELAKAFEADVAAAWSDAVNKHGARHTCDQGCAEGWCDRNAAKHTAKLYAAFSAALLQLGRRRNTT